MSYKTQYSRDKRLREEGFDSFSAVNNARAHRFRAFKVLPPEAMKN
ncbi:MAG TPA: hypothetical protein VLD37_03225 [Candidatus Bilamarchaeum sp.]|nr:hypothetical protein [Candidatus Bilamarchaeum sp.]